ncbi:hypothetical protein [Paenibacillus sonchi]|nr:hypothetical protein [Paenibacillus sonchi]
MLRMAALAVLVLSGLLLLLIVFKKNWAGLGSASLVHISFWLRWAFM